MARLLASPTLARWEISVRPLINLWPPSRPSLVPKTTMPTESVFKQLGGHPMGGIRRKPRIADPGDLVMAFSDTWPPQGHFLQWASIRRDRVSMPCKSIQALSGLMQAPRLRRGPTRILRIKAHRGKISPKSWAPAQVVVGGIRFIVELELRMAPVKGACIYHGTADGCAMSPHPFGQGMDDNIRAVVNGPENIGGGEGGINGQGQVIFFWQSLKKAEYPEHPGRGCQWLR